MSAPAGRRGVRQGVQTGRGLAGVVRREDRVEEHAADGGGDQRGPRGGGLGGTVGIDVMLGHAHPDVVVDRDALVLVGELSLFG